MATRTTEAAAIESTVATLKTQAAAYIAISNGGSDNPREILYRWVVGQLASIDEAFARSILYSAAPPIDFGTTHQTLTERDPWA